MTIGATIQRARTQCGMSRIELATKVGVNRVTIYQWEKDEIQIPPPYLKKVCRVLHINSFNVINSVVGKSEDAEAEMVALAWKFADPPIQEAVCLILGVKNLKNSFSTY